MQYCILFLILPRSCFHCPLFLFPLSFSIRSLPPPPLFFFYPNDLEKCPWKHDFSNLNRIFLFDVEFFTSLYFGSAFNFFFFGGVGLTYAYRAWIILDELNLAPSEVLEALNRLLDDNRELYIPETGEIIRAHPQFLLFATQNPPGLYGGRKVGLTTLFVYFAV